MTCLKDVSVSSLYFLHLLVCHYKYKYQFHQGKM